jgi:HD-GYP domain-containing protein (c-di-GMP phosphodiesterase class II)
MPDKEKTMFQCEIPIAVTTLDQKELLPAGTFLTEQVAADVAALGRLQPREECELLEYGTVRADLQRFLAIPPYLDIFSDQKLVEELLVQMQSVRLPLPLLNALDYFRQHDFHTYRHILMVFTLSSMLVSGMEDGRQKGEADFMAGPSHDFGKITVPLHILKSRAIDNTRKAHP